MTTRTKTLLLLCGFALCLAACAAPRYSRWCESPRGLDLSGGHWLVVPVETALPLADKEALTRLLAGSLRSMRGDSVDLLGEVALKYLSPAKFAAELRPKLLETLRKTTTYDYVVTARVTVPRSDMGTLGAIPGVWQKNEAEAILLVYDVSSGAVNWAVEQGVTNGTGETTFSMRSASLVPAKIEPMTKAPNADEKPA